ncbi:MAG: class I SAM-dependent methyltransferase [Planctomycetota bacterium]|jgi:cyclopropane fatty-acyl-phospholipid synthase-like methyltransferase
MGYDQEYAKVDALFGTEAEATLKQFTHRLPPDAPVLDIGAGQGRNALFLARRGLAVHAVEPSGIAVAALQQVAEQERLPMKLFPTTFEQFEPPVSEYAGILIFGLIPDLKWDAIRNLVEKVDHWSGRSTCVWVTGFTTDDPAYAHHRATWAALELNSFQSSEGRVRTYLEPGQILELFEQCSVLHHWEGLGPEHRHGDSPPERHGKFEAVLQKVGV